MLERPAEERRVVLQAGSLPVNDWIDLLAVQLSMGLGSFLLRCWRPQRRPNRGLLIINVGAERGEGSAHPFVVALGVRSLDQIDELDHLLFLSD
jgi:hypothetical protein